MKGSPIRAILAIVMADLVIGEIYKYLPYRRRS